jgi:hypothetical protein
VGNTNISNCPYQVQKLIQDQGLDSTFGRKDYTSRKFALSVMSHLTTEEIEKLQDILDKMIRTGMDN